MTPPPESNSPATITFSAKLPDDIGADEFAALVGAVSALDDAVVTSVRNSPEAEFFNSDLRTVAPSVVQKVQYGSDFMVVLGVVAQGAVPVGVVAGVWLTIAKSIDIIASARLKNEERKGKRDERLARRRERAAAEQVVKARYVWRLGSLEFLSVFEELPDGSDDDAEFPAKRVQEALDTLIPPETRAEAEAGLPADLRTQPVVVAVSQLAEYVVTVEVVPHTGGPWRATPA